MTSLCQKHSSKPPIHLTVYLCRSSFGALQVLLAIRHYLRMRRFRNSRLADVTGDIFYSLLILFQEPQTLRICQGSNLQDPFTQTTPKVSFQITAHATPPESVQLPPEFSVNSACSSRVLTTSTVGGRTCSSILFFVGGKLAGHRFLIDATTSKNQRQPLDIARVGSGAAKAFPAIKEALAQTSLLTHPLLHTPTRLMVDASDTAVSVVLQHYT